MVSWDKINIKVENGDIVEAQAPVIISASRATDIPSWYAEWFTTRLQKGYLVWINPFNQKPTYVAFDKTRVIVFWTKYAGPMIDYLDIITSKGLNYYFQYTLNDYEDENIEPNIPSLATRIENFSNLSQKIGKDRVIWRFDPLFLSDSVTIDTLISRIESIGDRIFPLTNKLVFSFIDIGAYDKVKNNLKKLSIREFQPEEMEEFAQKLNSLNRKWSLELATCGEEYLLQKFGIQQNNCIDGNLMLKLFPEDFRLKEFLRKNNTKDTGQRSACKCIVSKDIGQYNTCIHFCKYCYANRTADEARRNYDNHMKNPLSETIKGIDFRKRESNNRENDTVERNSKQLTL